MLFLLIILRTDLTGAVKVHMVIGLGENKIPDVFKFTRSKVKVKWVTFVFSFINSFY